MRLEIVVVARVEVPDTTEVPVVVLLVIVAFEITALVVVELPTMRSVMLARDATRDEKNPLVEVLLVVTRLVVVALVKVALVAVSEVKNAVVAARIDAKKLVVVASVKVAFVAVRLEIVVVARVEVPDTVRVPFARRFPLASTAKLRFSVQAEPFQ